MSNLNGKTVVVLVDELYNDLEFWYPTIRLEEAGAKVIVTGPEAGATYKSKYGMPAKADAGFADIDPDAVDGVVIPGGYAPDHMRRHKSCLDLVRFLNDQGKLVAPICHAGWVPISAGIVRGRRLTSFFAIKDDLVNAGAQWVDEAAVTDRNFVSSRSPADLPAFLRAVIAVLAAQPD